MLICSAKNFRFSTWKLCGATHQWAPSTQPCDWSICFPSRRYRGRLKSDSRESSEMSLLSSRAALDWVYSPCIWHYNDVGTGIKLYGLAQDSRETLPSSFVLPHNLPASTLRNGEFDSSCSSSGMSVYLVCCSLALTRIPSAANQSRGTSLRCSLWHLQARSRPR